MNPIPNLIQSKVFSTASMGATVTFSLNSPTSYDSAVLIAYVQIGGDATQPDAPAYFSQTGFSDLQQSTGMPNVYYGFFQNARALPTGTTSLSFIPATTGIPGTFIALEFGNFPSGFTNQDEVTDGITGFSGINEGTGTDVVQSSVISALQGANVSLALGINDGAQTMTPGSDWGVINTTNSGKGIALAYKAQNVITVIDPQFTMPSSAKWVSAVVDYVVRNPMHFTANTSIAATSATGSVAATYGAAVVAGNCLLASVYSNNGSPSIAGWTKIGERNYQGTQYVAQFYKTAAGTETTVTATAASATVMKLHIYECSYSANPVALDGSVYTYQTSGSVSTTPQIDLTCNNTQDLVFTTLSCTNAQANINSSESATGTNMEYNYLYGGALTDLKSLHDQFETTFNPGVLSTTLFWPTSSTAGVIASKIKAVPTIPDDSANTLATVGMGS